MPTGIQGSDPSGLASGGALPFPADFWLRFRLRGGRESGDVRTQTTEGVQPHNEEDGRSGGDPATHGALSHSGKADSHEHSERPTAEPPARAHLTRFRSGHGQWFFRAMITKSRTSRSSLFSAVMAVASRSSPTLSS